MSADRAAAVVDRFDHLLAAWLDTLRGEWEGTPRELSDALDGLNEAAGSSRTFRGRVGRPRWTNTPRRSPAPGGV